MAGEAACLPCWCGGALGDEVAPHYRQCTGCGSAILALRPGPEHFDVANDDRDFYGRKYWTDYATARNFPAIGDRACSDLSERCAFWIERLLDVVQPPGRALEIGCGHGGFMRLLQELGFDAVGTELSPWVVEFARQTFEVPVLLGPLEFLALEPGFRCIAAFDVLEHLSDPLDTMRRCRELLAGDGVLLLQTPCYRGEGPEWRMFQPDEHIHLFTESAVRLLLRRAGFESVDIQESLFPHDMWVVARPGNAAGAPRSSPAQVPAAFRAVVGLRRHLTELSRTIEVVDADRAERLKQINQLTAQIHELARRLETSDADREARLTQIYALTPQIHELTRRLAALDAEQSSRRNQIPELSRRLRMSEIDRAARLEQIEDLTRRLAISEADRATRLEQIEKLTRQLATAEADRAARLEQIEKLTRQLATAEADRAARLEQIEKLTRQLATAETDRAARLEQIEELTHQLATRLEQIEDLARQLATAEADRAARLMQIEELGSRLAISETDRMARLQQIDQLTRWLAASDADRMARLAQIDQLGRWLAASDADCLARLEQIQELTRRLETSEADCATRQDAIDALQTQLDTIRCSKVWRMYRAFRPDTRSS